MEKIIALMRQKQATYYVLSLCGGILMRRSSKFGLLLLMCAFKVVFVTITPFYVKELSVLSENLAAWMPWVGLVDV